MVIHYRFKVINNRTQVNFLIFLYLNTVLDVASDENKGIINYVFDSQLSRALQIMFLPWTLPFEFSLNFTKKSVIFLKYRLIVFLKEDSNLSQIPYQEPFIIFVEKNCTIEII